MISESTLIRQAQSGDTAAFCQLARAYERRIYSLALHYCRNSHDAEDLSQEVWLKAYQALKAFRGDSSFYTWLRRITINCFLNYRRSRLFKRESKDDFDSVEMNQQRADISLETTVLNKILIDRVLQALAAVTSHQRLIFLLKHHEGMTCEEIARELGCSSGTVKKSLFRTVARLRAELETNGQPLDYIPCTAEHY